MTAEGRWAGTRMIRASSQLEPTVTPTATTADASCASGA